MPHQSRNGHTQSRIIPCLKGGFAGVTSRSTELIIDRKVFNRMEKAFITMQNNHDLKRLKAISKQLDIRKLGQMRQENQ